MKVGMLFPGYGSQFVGMGKELYDDHRVVQEYFETAANCLDTNFVKLCFASSDAELSRMGNAYPATFLVSCAIAALLKEQFGLDPDVVAGYNLGEYAAIHTAGGLSFPDGLYLLSKFASIYEEEFEGKEVGALRVTGMATKELERVCKKSGAVLAIYTAQSDHIVTGTFESLGRVRELVIDLDGVKIADPGIEVGLHSSLVEPVLDKFKMYQSKVDFKDLSIPLLGSVDAKAISAGEKVKKAVNDAIVKPLLWSTVMDKHIGEYDLIIEVGPGSMLINLVKEAYPDKLAISINKRSDIDELEKLIEKHLVEAKKTDG